MFWGLFGGASRPPFDIWFARDIQHEYLQRWMIVVKYHRIQIVRTPEGDFELNYDYEPDWTAEHEFTKPIIRGRMSGPNSLNGYHLIPIGFTDTYDEDVSRYVKEVLNAHAHPSQRLSWAEGQILLWRFVGLILHRGHPSFYEFFAGNMDLNRRDERQLPSNAHFLALVEKSSTFPNAVDANGRVIYPSRNANLFDMWKGSYIANQNQFR